MSSTLKIFNTQLLNFSSAMSERFPNNRDLKVALTGLKTLSSMNPKKTMELFLTYTYKYRDIVMSKDEQRLINTDFSVDLKQCKELVENPENTNEVIETLRKNWTELSSEEKDNIWKYLQVLMTLTDKHIAESLGK
jgi:hypothetical protein